MQETFNEIRGRSANLNNLVLDHAITHVFIDADGGLQPVVGRLMFGGHIVGVLLGIVDDVRPVGRYEQHTL
jgi:hypothetical protein